MNKKLFNATAATLTVFGALGGSGNTQAQVAGGTTTVGVSITESRPDNCTRQECFICDRWSGRFCRYRPA
jgi:hypothetical protein